MYHAITATEDYHHPDCTKSDNMVFKKTSSKKRRKSNLKKRIKWFSRYTPTCYWKTKSGEFTILIGYTDQPVSGYRNVLRSKKPDQTCLQKNWNLQALRRKRSLTLCSQSNWCSSTVSSENRDDESPVFLTTVRSKVWSGVSSSTTWLTIALNRPRFTNRWMMRSEDCLRIWRRHRRRKVISVLSNDRMSRRKFLSSVDQ